MLRSSKVTITLSDGTVETYRDVPYMVANNAHVNAGDKRPESHYLLVTLPRERRQGERSV